MKKVVFCFLICLCAMLTNLYADSASVEQTATKSVYCEYCGHKFPNARLLLNSTCPRHPNGSNKGNHKLYEGSEKSKYTCKYCGKSFHSIQAMIGGSCSKHPSGSNKGNHSPAL
ncbi:MAG: C2H2-type zinc finger protein [Phocaeicola sp.]